MNRLKEKPKHQTKHPGLALLMLLSLCPTAFAEPSESILADRVETQAEVAVGQTNFSAPPMSRFSILVSEAAQDRGNSSQQLNSLGDSSTQPLEFVGDKPGAITTGQFLTASEHSTLTPLQSLEGSPQISALAGQASDAIQLLNFALEKSGDGNNAFLTLSAKGAIQAWNNMVNSLMDRMEQLYRDPVPDAKEWGSIRNFLMDPKTHDYRGVLASFVEKKSAK